MKYNNSYHGSPLDTPLGVFVQHPPADSCERHMNGTADFKHFKPVSLSPSYSFLFSPEGWGKKRMPRLARWPAKIRHCRLST